MDRANKDQNKEIEIRYRSYVNEAIIHRLRIMAPIGIAIHLVFNILDWVTYPPLAIIFLKIRCIGSVLLLIAILLTYLPTIKLQIIWIVDIIGIAIAADIALMIFLADGSSSRYYEGLNLIVLAMGILNSFDTKHNIISFSIMIVLYEFAMLTNGAAFNKVNFCFANFFMISTALFVVLLTKFYSSQHHRAYLRQEQLKLSEEKLTALYSQADQLSKTDELTKINNRRHFFEMLQNKIDTSKKNKSYFYLVIFDVDYFKELNDRWGHSFGDLALTKVVEIVKKNIRNNDCLGRFGGDEFILFLDIPDREMLSNRLIKISQGVTSLNLTQQDHNVLISISIGAARFNPDQNMTKDQLLEKADEQLLLVKKTNRGQICIAD